MANPSFADRIATLRTIANELHAFGDTLARQMSGFADTLMLEVERMEAVQNRFQQRVGQRGRKERTND